MRVGINPEKTNARLLTWTSHRVILPVYVASGAYFKDAEEVVKLCVESLLSTIDPVQSRITIIDNGCTPALKLYFSDLLSSGRIDRLIINSENRGKVEPVLKEARGSGEDYITIADADTFFCSGWLKATMEIFSRFERAGVVSPIPEPHLYLYCNYHCFLQNLFLGRLHRGSILDETEMEGFYRQINFSDFTKLRKQFYLKKGTVSAILGATHQVATYKRTLFETPSTKVLEVFGKGVEKKYLDVLNIRLGTWRLATSRFYADHIGNVISKHYSVVDSRESVLFPTMKYIYKPVRESRIGLVLSQAISKMLSYLLDNKARL